MEEAAFPHSIFYHNAYLFPGHISGSGYLCSPQCKPFMFVFTSPCLRYFHSSMIWHSRQIPRRGVRIKVISKNWMEWILTGPRVPIRPSSVGKVHLSFWNGDRTIKHEATLDQARQYWMRRENIHAGIPRRNHNDASPIPYFSLLKRSMCKKLFGCDGAGQSSFCI